jgi:hypothetical protein
VTRLTVAGHMVVVTPCDGLRDHWQVRADGQFIGLVSSDAAGYHTLPALSASCCRNCAPVCYCPTQPIALATLIAETIDHQDMS